MTSTQYFPPSQSAHEDCNYLDVYLMETYQWHNTTLGLGNRLLTYDYVDPLYAI